MVISGQGSSGLVHDGEGAADEKYEEDDACSVGHADGQGHHCVEEVHRVRGDRLERARHYERAACHVVGSSIELTRRHHIAHERRGDDAAGEQDQRMREAQPRGLAHRGLEFIGHDFGD